MTWLRMEQQAKSLKIGIVGLGRMGANMVKRLVARGHACVVFDQSEERRAELASLGAEPAASLEKLVSLLAPPRAAWVMLPAGAATEETISRLGTLLQAGDTVVDGGNTHFKDDIRRAETLGQRGIHYLDVGVSGGIWGRERGYCLMIGGERSAAARLEPVFRSLATGADEPAPQSGSASTAERGYQYCGAAGAAHFVKMVHNGIEYGMMQSLAEGFHLLQSSSYDLALAQIAEVWRHGSVVSSWLLDLTALALKDDPRLEAYEGRVDDSGEGRWTVQAAVELGVPVEVLALSLFERFRSRDPQSFADKLLSAMRHGFGGHSEYAQKRKSA